MVSQRLEIVIEKLSNAQFSEYLGEPFQLHLEPELALTLELIEVTPLGRRKLGEDEQSIRQEPFSLLFRGPLEMELPQRIYPLEHSKLGRLDIFLVPVARQQDGMRYEAIFT
ncbi:MAG: hypothetical protein F6J86_01955 [Symploca sp. SIO1B1]|nr:hypothetical protein [Symploca sp. SIO1A3]NER92621.1 hypothetical protein [Symploca sp. SIO1B1]